MTDARIPCFAGFLAVSVVACASGGNRPTQSEGPTIGAVAKPAETTDPLPQAMTFRWPEGGIVHVTEASEKDGKAAETAYDLHICPSDNGLTILYRNFRFVSLGGLPADDPRVRDQVRQAAPLLRLIPDLRVANDGSLLELVGFREAIQLLSESLSDPKLRKAIGTLLANPSAIEMLEAKASETWSAWVSTWAPFEPRGAATQSFTYDDPGPNGPEPQVFELERVAVEGPLMRLRVTTEEGNEELEELLPVVQSIIEAMGDSVDAQELFRKAILRRVTTWQVLTDPNTMRPSEVETEMKLSLSIPGVVEDSRREHKLYTFDWASSAQGGADCAP